MKTILSLLICFHWISLLAQLDDSPVSEFPDTIYYQYPEVTISKGDITLPDNTEFADTINDPFGIIYSKSGQYYLSIQKGKNIYTFCILSSEELYEYPMSNFSVDRIDLNNDKKNELIFRYSDDFWHASACGGGGYTNKRMVIWDLDKICKLFGQEYFYEVSSWQNTECFPPENADSTFEGEWVEDLLEEEKYLVDFRPGTITFTPEQTDISEMPAEYHNYTGTEKIIYRLQKKYMLRIK